MSGWRAEMQGSVKSCRHVGIGHGNDETRQHHADGRQQGQRDQHFGGIFAHKKASILLEEVDIYICTAPNVSPMGLYAIALADAIMASRSVPAPSPGGNLPSAGT